MLCARCTKLQNSRWGNNGGRHHASRCIVCSCNTRAPYQSVILPLLLIANIARFSSLTSSRRAILVWAEEHMQGCALSSLECPNIIPGSGVDGISSGMALLLVITFLFIVCKIFGLRSCCLFGVARLSRVERVRGSIGRTSRQCCCFRGWPRCN